MAMDVLGLKTAIQEAFDFDSDIDVDPAEARARQAQKIADAIHAFVLTGGVHSIVTGGTAEGTMT